MGVTGFFYRNKENYQNEEYTGCTIRRTDGSDQCDTVRSDPGIKKRSEIDRIYGAFHGVQGILAGEIVALDDTFRTEASLTLLEKTPAAALGSCRLKLKDSAEHADQYAKIIEIFRMYEIHYFVYIGGNDSMDTVLQLSKYCAENGIPKFLVIPKNV